MHYSQQMPRLETAQGQGPRTGRPLMHVRGYGFITVTMVREALANWPAGQPSAVLIDLRDVAGYEAGCGRLARQWLHDTAGSHCRIALVASSSVLRVAVSLFDIRGSNELRHFGHVSNALDWLDRDHAELRPLPNRVVSSRPRL